MRMSIEEYRNLPEVRAQSGFNKFGAKKTEYDGVIYDSMVEAERAQELHFLKLAGKVKSVELQPRFDIIVNGVKVAYYVADFRITYPDGHVEIEDVKGLKKGAAYSLFKLKKKLVEALYSIEIKEV